MLHDGHDAFSLLNFRSDLKADAIGKEGGGIKLWIRQYVFVANAQPRSLTSESYALVLLV